METVGILGYILGWVILYNKGYQGTSPLVGSASIKIKGSAWSNGTSSNGSLVVWDSYDVVYPPTELNAFFVSTGFHRTIHQQQGECTGSDWNATEACINGTNECLKGAGVPTLNGLSTGICNNSADPPACIINGWCPPETINKTELPEPIYGVDAFTVYFRINVRFTEFGISLSNSDVGGDPVTGVNMWPVGDMVTFAGLTYPEAATNGTIIIVSVTWDCDFDHHTSECKPAYSWFAVDTNTASSFGYNFRYPNYYYDDTGVYTRDLLKVNGIRFIVLLGGSGRKFDIIALVLNISSGVALLGVASVLVDILLMYFFPRKKANFYTERKYELVDDPDDNLEHTPIIGHIDQHLCLHFSLTSSSSPLEPAEEDLELSRKRPVFLLPSDDIGAKIDALLSPYSDPRGPGAALLVMRHSQVLITRTLGMADVRQQTPISISSNFRLASLSKQFTAAAVNMLVREGKLNYDDPIERTLESLPSWVHGVNVGHLIEHTSGLPDYEDFVPPTQTRQVPSLLSQASSLLFPPGTQYRYSNTGYCLLALLIARRSGQRFAKFLEDRLFFPLQMQGAVAFEEGYNAVPDRVYGYAIAPNAHGEVECTMTDQSNTSATLGDGGIYLSLSGWRAWITAPENILPNGCLLERGATRISPYCHGYFVDSDDENKGLLCLSHHGETTGFTNAFLRYPSVALTIILLTNRTVRNTWQLDGHKRDGCEPWHIAQQIADLYLKSI